MTKKVICTLPNASEEINGVKFDLVDGVRVADGLADDVAEQFEGIRGYEVKEAKKAETAAEKKAREKAEKEAAEAAAAESKPADETPAA